MFRPATGEWYILQSSTSTTAHHNHVGLSTDVIVPGDYDGDGKTDLGVFRPSTGLWYILTSSTNYTNYLTTSWGVDTDIALLRR